MAVYPCDWSAHRYPGTQRSVYVTVAEPDSVQTFKLRFCPKHFLDEWHIVQDELAVVDEDSTISDTCLRCEEERTHGLYVKFFDEGKEPVEYAGDFCAAHVHLVALELKAPSGRAMRER